jgi:hypothetical protein
VFSPPLHSFMVSAAFNNPSTGSPNFAAEESLFHLKAHLIELKCPSHYHIYRSVTCNVIQLIINTCEVGHRGGVIMITVRMWIAETQMVFEKIPQPRRGRPVCPPRVDGCAAPEQTDRSAPTLDAVIASIFQRPSGSPDWRF